MPVHYKDLYERVTRFLRAKKPWRSKWFGMAIIVLATLIYFFPLILRLGTYMTGGDSMFNAWVMERNQHCLLREHCPEYSNANIYYPNKDSMLYSEVEISPSVVTLPLHFLSPNPILPYNVVTILTFVMLGLSMYWLALYLSKGNWYYSLLAGLLFEFGPTLMASTYHLQSLSVFCYPLAFLAVFKYLDTHRRRYLALLLGALLYCFFASWYQMIFMLGMVGVLLLFVLWRKRATWRDVGIMVAVVGVACVITLPLVTQYLHFSKESQAKYTLTEKVADSSGLPDYAITPSYTPLGQLIQLVSGHHWNLYSKVQTLSYGGISLYVLVFAVGPYLVWRRRLADKKLKYEYLLFGFIALAMFVISLGPLLKIGVDGFYHIHGLTAVIPMPAMLIHLFVPQLGFMRGLARAAALMLFAMCCLLAILGSRIAPKWSFYKRHALLINCVVGLVLAVDILPGKMIPLDPNPHAYHSGVPAVYQRIKDDPKIDDIVVLQAKDYPHIDFWFARTEVVLWSAYFNRNIYNGYSGYEPPTFEAEYSDFVNLDPSDPVKMRARGLKYVIVDRELYTNKPEVLASVPGILGKPIYHDSRYDMYKL